MAQPSDVVNCIRQRVEINGDNYYLIVGEDFVQATVPRENDPRMTKERETVETLCSHISTLMGELKSGGE